MRNKDRTPGHEGECADSREMTEELDQRIQAIISEYRVHLEALSDDQAE